jgi:hypothetical protein
MQANRHFAVSSQKAINLHIYKLVTALPLIVYCKLLTFNCQLNSVSSNISSIYTLPIK